MAFQTDTFQSDAFQQDPNISISAPSAVLTLISGTVSVSGTSRVDAPSAVATLNTNSPTITTYVSISAPSSHINLVSSPPTVSTQAVVNISTPTAILRFVSASPDVLVEPYVGGLYSEFSHVQRAPDVYNGIVATHKFIPFSAQAPEIYSSPSSPKQVTGEGLPNAVGLFWSTPRESSRWLLRIVATGGTFRLTFETPEGTRENGSAFTTAAGTSQTTGTIPYNATASDVRDKLLALSNIDVGDVLVGGELGSPANYPNGPPDVISIEFQGQYRGVLVDTLSLDPTSLVGATTTDLEGPPPVLPALQDGVRYRTEVWTGAFDTGTLVRRDEYVSAEEMIYPTSDYETHYMRVHTVSPLGDVSSWSTATATPHVAVTSDGSAPDSSGAPTVRGGPGYLAIEWDPVDNDSTVTYEVHISTTSGFTPSASTLSGEVDGTLFFIRAMPNGSALTYGTTYYVKIIAKDVDGTASTSPQGSGQMVQVNSADLVANNIITNSMLVGSITADKLNVSALDAISANIGNITAGTITGVTFTGGTFRTASSGARIEMVGANAERLVLYTSGGEAGRIAGQGSQNIVLVGTNGITIDAQDFLSLDGATIGFFGSVGIAKWNVTGSKGGNAALGSLLGALVAMNMISDSSTA